MRITFNEVSLKVTHRWIDPVTGKRRQETRKFWQTINPFNKNADGSIKTADEIQVELRAQRDAWLASLAANGADHA